MPAQKAATRIALVLGLQGPAWSENQGALLLTSPRSEKPCHKARMSCLTVGFPAILHASVFLLRGEGPSCHSSSTSSVEMHAPVCFSTMQILFCDT